MYSKDVSQKIQSLIQSVEIQESPFIPGQTCIPASGKVIGEREKMFMIEAALDGWLTTGRFNDLFEQKLGTYLNVRHVLTVNSGSSANLLAISALTSPELKDRAISAGDEVITVAAGFPTTLVPILQCGAVPVFVDVDPHTWNLDPTQLEAALSPRTKAVIVAHTLGNPFNIDAIQDFCTRHSLWLVEDCCDALGATWDGKHVGMFGHLATLSFYPAHHITTGEGGAVFSNDSNLIRIVASFRDWGRHCHCRPGQDNRCGQRYTKQFGQLPEGYDHKYVYSHMGYNLKMTDMQAACGVAQMERIEQFVSVRRKHFDLLKSLINTDFLLPMTAYSKACPSWFGFPVLLKEDAPHDRLHILRELEQKHIGTRLLFAGNAVRQPFMDGKRFRTIGNLPHTDAIMQRAFWLGVHPGLHEEMLQYIATTLNTLCTS